MPGLNLSRNMPRSLALLMVLIMGGVFVSCGKPLLSKSKKGEASQLFEQAEFFFHQGEYPNALDLYQRVEHRKSDYPGLQHRIGLCYAKTRFYAKAKEYFLKEIARNPQNWDAHIDLGMAYSRLSQVEQAEKSYLFVLNRDPENAKAHLNLGILLINRKGDKSEGLTHLKKYLEYSEYSAKQRRIAALVELFEEEYIFSDESGESDGESATKSDDE